jgi:hypothetical protein
MPGGGVDAELFRSLEQALQSPEVRASSEAVAALLAESFVEFGSSGKIYDKAVVVDALEKETSPANSSLPEMRDFAAQALGPDTVLVTYRSVRLDGANERSVLRSSIWTRIGDTWQMLFHQGTIAAPP